MMRRTIAYWGATGLTAFAFAFGGMMDVLQTPDIVASMAHLGYPAYLAPLLGVWKLLAAAALVAPRLPLLKEWAYAGITFDLTGAAFSHAASGDGAGVVLVPLVVLGIAAASWALRPASRRLLTGSATAAERNLSPA